MKIAKVIAPLFVLVAQTACGGEGSKSSASDSFVPVDTIVSHGMSFLPDDEPRDIVDFSDAVVEISVTTERFAEGDPAGDVGLGQTVLRYVSVNVDSVIWGEANLLGTELELQTLGGVATPDGYLAEVEPGAPSLDVGRSYVVALFVVNGEWSQQTGLTVFPIEDGRLDLSDHALRDSHPFDGLTVDELRAFLAGITLDPEVEGLRDLPAVERLERVEAG